MRISKSPDAVAARGASECDHLERQVSLEAKRQKTFPQGPIRAELIGSDGCEAEGIRLRGYAPVLDICRALIRWGHDPKRALHAYRGGRLALAVRSIGEGALLTVKDDRRGTPLVRRWWDQRYGRGSPAARIDNRQGVLTATEHAIWAAVP